MLIHYAMVDYLPFAAYQIKNGGIFKHSSETAETVSKSEVDYLVNKEREFAEYYTRRFIDYMAFNQQVFLSILAIQMTTYRQTETVYSTDGYYETI